MPIVTVDVDVDAWEFIGELHDVDLIDLIDEMKRRGYNVQKEEFDTDVLDREDLDYLIERVSDLDWPDGRHVYDKLRKLRFG